MKPKYIILFLILVTCRTVLPAQSYVPNASFEGLSGCPDDTYQIYKAPPWFSPYNELGGFYSHGYAILFTSKVPCTGELVGVPKNSWCFQYAHSGDSYAGIEVVSAKVEDRIYRQYLETKLTTALKKGKKYYFSMFYNLCYPQNVSIDTVCFRTDSLGAYFSEKIIDTVPSWDVLPVTPQVHDGSRKIAVNKGWQGLTGCLTANGNEQYMLIANFAGNKFSNCSLVDTIGYYLLIDDVALIEEQTKQIDTVLCNGADWPLDAQYLRNEYLYLNGWQYQWSDGSTDSKRKFTAPGDYTLQVSNKDCFTDVYTIKIRYADCSCKDYIPNTFTPNGDNLNDKFIPHIVCETQGPAHYKFSIYDRWGTRIFFTTSVTQAWDGMVKGKPAGTGEYVYIVQYQPGPLQPVKTVKGTVLLLR